LIDLKRFLLLALCVESASAASTFGQSVVDATSSGTVRSRSLHSTAEGGNKACDVNHPGVELSSLSPNKDALSTCNRLNGIPEPGKVKTKLLLVVSDHGSGSTAYEAALGMHQCAFSLGEPFEGKATEHGQGFLRALVETANAKLEENIIGQAEKKWTVNPPVPKEAYNCLSSEGMGTYLMRVAENVCSHMPAELRDKCDGKCVATAKVFPAYVAGNTGPVNSAKIYDINDPYGKGAYGGIALALWNSTLSKLMKMPSVSMVTLKREEAGRALSVWRRFDYLQAWYNCDVARAGKSTVYDQSARAITGAPVVDIADCKGETGQRACLQKALTPLALDANDVDLSPFNISQTTQSAQGIAGDCVQGGWIKGDGTGEGGKAVPVPQDEVDKALAEQKEYYAKVSKAGKLFRLSENGYECFINVAAPARILP
jgi:hypothetical protein